ncbi:MAG TPA: outer membrane beta-barrel protein, partial [Polyangiaceae bacterium]|nr:outer membrane beta-barrel protein [Polyangiaceae bacterium]
ELHPGVGGEFGYDSNYFLRSPDDSPKPVDTLRLRITPSFSVSTTGAERKEGDSGVAEPPKIGFRAAVAGTYSEFIATKSANSDELSKQRNISGVGTLSLRILPGRTFGGDVYADVVRSVQPANDPSFNYNRFTARFGGGVIWAPGGGMFDWRVGYEYGLVYFEDRSFRGLSNDSHSINTRGRWRFLPRTAVLYDGSATFLRYNQGPSGAQLNSNPIRARLGLNGLVTRQLALLAMAGWASSFYAGANAQQYDGLIAQAELKWFITPGTGNELIGGPLPISTAALGYSRDFFNSYLGDFAARDRFYLTLSHLFSGRFLLVLDGSYSPIRYAPVFNAARAQIYPSFTAPRVDASLFGEYRLSESFGLNATLRYSANITDDTPSQDPVGWTRYEAYLGVRWFL